MAIQDTLIGDPQMKDQLVWPEVKNGMYSVKSGYFWLRDKDRPSHNILNSVLASIPTAFWKCLWGLKVPPKIRCFLWKSMHGALATKANLFRRKSSPSPMCPLCNRHDETTEHLFLRCPWVVTVWFGGCLNLRLQGMDLCDWVVWLKETFLSVRGTKEEKCERLQYVAFCCWHIWLARCDFVFNQKTICPNQVLAAIAFSINAFKDAGKSCVPPPSPSATVVASIPRWCPPCLGFMKINVDASWVTGGGDGFIGVVARDDVGKFFAACRYGIKAMSVACAEALAILLGCELGISCGWRSIIIESDSADSINFLQDVAKLGSWEAFPTLVKCSRLGKSFHQCRWSWVPRLANSAADLLASRNCREACDVVWVDRPPSSLVNVLCNDGLPGPP